MYQLRPRPAYRSRRSRSSSPPSDARQVDESAVSSVTARDICAAILELTATWFYDRDHALRKVTEWGLRGSEDVGRVIFAISAAGWTTADDGDSPDDFVGLIRFDAVLNDPG